MPPKGSRRTSVQQPKVKNPADVSSTNALSREAEDQLELELCWCIQQLEMCLASGKLQEKQAHDLARNVNVLKSNTAPLIKKRQVMRNTLGDYRQKMADDEQKLNKNTLTVKFTNNVPGEKCMFLKKSLCKSTQVTKTMDKTMNENSMVASLEPTSDFRFNFN